MVFSRFGDTAGDGLRAHDRAGLARRKPYLQPPNAGQTAVAGRHCLYQSGVSRGNRSRVCVVYWPSRLIRRKDYSHAVRSGISHRRCDPRVSSITRTWRGSVSRGRSRPDHAIRIKPLTLLVLPPAGGDAAGFVRDVKRPRRSCAIPGRDYNAYVKRGTILIPQHPKTPLDPSPRILLVPGFGLFCRR